MHYPSWRVFTPHSTCDSLLNTNYQDTPTAQQRSVPARSALLGKLVFLAYGLEVLISTKLAISSISSFFLLQGGQYDRLYIMRS